MTKTANLQIIREQIMSNLQAMGYYPSSIKMSSIESDGAHLIIEGEFAEYLGDTMKFKTTFDVETNGFLNFIVK